ncbi:uncharacterized protein LOC108846351 isoform X2 [Raphanus sativus]|uniref:Uncharacterized protein LOC108846351 isoform X2 n=1 Tax=Raphanus sativus TaxID=3726 RepID=A0A6J0MRL5_RAPSA|nr:uncharacterized protein LOC108846351 isoform X2 [Raphanus sativus]
MEIDRERVEKMGTVQRMEATGEYATAKIAVWWDMKDCPIPEDYEAGQVRSSLEAAFKEQGYSGPVSITAYGDQTQTPDHILKGLSSTGVSVAHTKSESTCHFMYEDLVKWRRLNPPPATNTMMIISDEVGDKFTWDLVRLQQRTLYKLFLAYSVKPEYMVLSVSEQWCWKKLLSSSPPAAAGVQQGGAKFYCKSCSYDSGYLKKFKKHLSSYSHAREEFVNPTDHKLVRYTEDWGRNYKATPEFATAKIHVWWDLSGCPIPEGYDARQVRPSIEAAVKELGYYGPVSITAYRDHKHTPLQALSSTGVDVAHTVSDVTYSLMFNDMLEWHRNNPPQTAALIMVISDNVEIMARRLVKLLQENNYNFFLAYSFRPYKMSYLLTSAEWLWESILSGEERLLQNCSSSSGSGDGQSTSRFYCRLCVGFITISIDKFRAHLSNEEHAQEENEIREHGEYHFVNERLCQLAEYDGDHLPRATI